MLQRAFSDLSNSNALHVDSLACSFWMSDSGATFTSKFPGGSRSGGSDAKKRKRVEKKEEEADDDAEEM